MFIYRATTAAVFTLVTKVLVARYSQSPDSVINKSSLHPRSAYEYLVGSDSLLTHAGDAN